MTFLHVLFIIFCAPLYFLVRGKWLRLIFNLIPYCIAVGLVLSIVGAFFAIPFWIISVIHGVWDLRKDIAREHAQIMATEMAAAIRESVAGPQKAN